MHRTVPRGGNPNRNAHNGRLPGYPHNLRPAQTLRGPIHLKREFGHEEQVVGEYRCRQLGGLVIQEVGELCV